LQTLGCAHASGIVTETSSRRTFFVTKRGHAKVLDFGLAKLTATAGGRKHGATQATLGASHEQAHRSWDSLGTLAYMSPEQALGKELDARTDLFSFGAVLLRDGTGRLPFRGENFRGNVRFDFAQGAVAPVRLNPDLRAAGRNHQQGAGERIGICGISMRRKCGRTYSG